MKPEAIDIRIATHGSSEYEQEVEVRRRILRRPLGLDFSEEELAAEHAETHIVAVADGRVVGCAVMVHKEGGVAKMRQVAVEPEL
ncbi:MAG TPA: hypothetical protein VMI31_04600, partial [Fimbriimonadaceae bacterium]|nr:hypothetical protein [Fimbriimonadaceae bacterium]